MALPWKVRLILRTQTALQRTRLVTNERLVRQWPVEKRLASAPAKRLVGPVPDVSTSEETVTTRDGASIRVRVYRAKETTDQPILYAHGGGFAFGGIAACDHICRRLADESGAIVVSVEYRLAPEHRFPVPLHDVLDAADWVVAHADELGVDPRKLVVGGDSAVGNLAAALAVVFRDEGRPLAGQLLIYPTVDLAMSLPGIHAYRGLGQKGKELVFVREAYLGDHDPTDPLASPLFADASGLAPALVLTVHHDALRGEGVAYAEKLLAAGVPTEHIDIEDHAHGSLSLPTLYRGIDEIYEAMSRFVRRVVAPAG